MLLPGRRQFLGAAALASSSLALGRLMQVQALAGGPARPTADACILVFLNGGMSHLDTFDPKPHQPGAWLAIEPTVAVAASALVRPMDLHHLDLGRVFQLVRALGGRLPCLRRHPAGKGIPCLSEPVGSAGPRAVEFVEASTAELMALDGERGDERA